MKPSFDCFRGKFSFGQVMKRNLFLASPSFEEHPTAPPPSCWRPRRVQRARRRATSTSPSPPPSPRAAPSVSTRPLRRRRLAANTFTSSQKVQIAKVWVVDVVVVMRYSCWWHGPKQGQRNISFAWRVVWKERHIQGYFRLCICICRILGLVVCCIVGFVDLL